MTDGSLWGATLVASSAVWARSLYRSLGYAETAVWMRKEISEPRD